MSNEKHKHVIPILAMGMISALVSPAAPAYFAWQPAPAAPAASFELVGYNPVVQIGHGQPRESGFGRDLTIDQALEFLAPDDFARINLDAGDLRVSWDAQEDWIDALEQIGRDHDLRFLVNWNEKKVYVSKAHKQEPHVIGADHREASPDARAHPAPTGSHIGPVREHGHIHAFEEVAGDFYDDEDEVYPHDDAPDVSGYAPEDDADDDYAVEPETHAAEHRKTKEAGHHDAPADEAGETEHHAEPAPVADEKPQSDPVVVWRFQPGSLRQGIEGLAAAHGWQDVVWASTRDFRVVGGFEVKADNLLDALRIVASYYPVRARLYEVNKVVYIETKESGK